jgi:hypothetical protein
MNENKSVESLEDVKREFTEWIEERLKVLTRRDFWKAQITENSVKIGVDDEANGGFLVVIDACFGRRPFGDVLWKYGILTSAPLSARGDRFVDYYIGLGRILDSDFFNTDLMERLNGEFTERVEAIKDYIRNRSK